MWNKYKWYFLDSWSPCTTLCHCGLVQSKSSSMIVLTQKNALSWLPSELNCLPIIQCSKASQSSGHTLTLCEQQAFTGQTMTAYTMHCHSIQHAGNTTRLSGECGHTDLSLPVCMLKWAIVTVGYKMCAFVHVSALCKMLGTWLLVHLHVIM